MQHTCIYSSEQALNVYMSMVEHTRADACTIGSAFVRLQSSPSSVNAGDTINPTQISKFVHAKDVCADKIETQRGPEWESLHASSSPF